MADERAAAGLLLPTTMRAILDLAEQGVDYLEPIVARWRAGGVAVTAEVARGDPVPTVLDLAEQHDADLLIMASHGRAGLDAILAGSVAPRIADRVGRPCCWSARVKLHNGCYRVASDRCTRRAMSSATLDCPRTSGRQVSSSWRQAVE